MSLLSAEQIELNFNCTQLLQWLSTHPQNSTTPTSSSNISTSTMPSPSSSSSPTTMLKNYQVCEISKSNAAFSYLIAISNDNKCYIALNSNVYIDKLVEVQYPVDIFKGISSGTSIGTISGQFSTFSRYFPFATVLNLLSKHKLTTAIITGIGWSGTLAHILTFILRELGRSIKLKIPFKCVSFSGPLCASQSFHNFLHENHLIDHHLTINYHHFIFDRILFNYQQLSLLTHCDIESWRPIYENLFTIIIKYQHILQRSHDDPVVEFDLNLLIKAEELLVNHPEHVHSGDALLQPIGTYLFQFENQASSFVLHGDRVEISKVLRSLDNFIDPSDYFLSTPVEIVNLSPRQSKYSKEISIKPVINSLNVVKYSQRSTLIFDGSFLDCTLGREARNEIQLVNDLSLSNSEGFELIPFFIQSGSYEVQPNAKILFVRAMGNKVIIDVSGFLINSSLQIGLRTDFGESNCVSFDPASTIAKDDSTPISLHPVMNSSFLLGALLRVALCYRDCNTIEHLKEKYPFIFHLWVFLLDLERTCPLPNPLLDIQMQAYVNGQFDLLILKNVCNKRMEDISLYITTLENDTESTLLHGARTMLGGLGRLTGGLITTAGVILTVPSMILSLPAAMYVANQNRNRNNQEPLSIGVGTGLYLSLVGILSIPGVFVAGLGAVLSSAGSYAMKDKESINYKNILYTLLSLLGENNQEIVDEITPLENHVIELFSRYFPQCNLLSHSPEEICQLIQKEVGNSKVQNIQAINLIKYYKKNKNIFMKIKLIYKIHHIRKLMENNLFITFLGVNNRKKSVILNKLFEIDLPQMRSYLCSNENFLTSAAGVHFGVDPSIHLIGNWMNEQQKKNESFREWMNKNERNMLQLYAIDYPYLHLQRTKSNDIAVNSSTTTDGPPSPPTTNSSNYSVELSSIFIILLTEEPHNISSESMAYVDLAKSNHKPYLVLIDLTSESLTSVITTPGQYESYKESYSRELDIPVDLIHFTNPLDTHSTDKLRGLLFGMVQNLIASPYMSQVLSLKFLPSHVIEQLISTFHSPSPADHTVVSSSSSTSSTTPGGTLQVVGGGVSSENADTSTTAASSSHSMDILAVPDILATATSSLLYNLCPLNGSTIRDSCRQLLTENSPEILKKSDRRSTLQTLPFGIHIQSQQIAFTLSIPDSIYLLFIQILAFRLKLFKEYLKNSKNQNSALGVLNLLSQSSEVNNMLSVLVLTFIRQQVNEYLEIGQNQTSPGDKTNIQYLCTEILLALQIWINIWVEKGYSAEIVTQAVEVALSETTPITNSHFLQIINRLHTSLSLLESSDEQFNDSLGPTQPPPLLRRASSTAVDRQLLSRFQFTRDQYTQIMKIISFQPFHDIVLNDQITIDDHTLALQRYNESMKEYNKSHTATSKVVLTRNTGIVLEIIDRLMSLTSEDLKKSKLMFTVLTESAVDVNGVTRSVLSQIAKEINENPSILLLKKDEQSNLIYFDPDSSSQTDSALREHIQFIYTGFGRLIGLCLIKASVGVTLPIDLPLTFYRLILGYRLSMNDLFITNPQIAISLSNICLMDQETLEYSGLDFTVTRNDHTVYELIPNGANHPVTIHNRVEYIRKALQYYLCSHEVRVTLDSLETADSSSFNPLMSFVIGIQSVCSRHYFHHFNPISLQLLLEGNRLDIDVAEWRAQTEYRLQGGNLFQTHLIPQNPSLNELTGNIEQGLGAGVGGGEGSGENATLPQPAVLNSLANLKEESFQHPTIQMFWEVVTEMDEVDKRRLLCFSVGTTSLPSNGFSGLQPKFTLVIGTLSPESLPVSHTCFHMLILPKYETKEIMKEKLLQAIRETGIADLGIV